MDIYIKLVATEELHQNGHLVNQSASRWVAAPQHEQGNGDANEQRPLEQRSLKGNRDLAARLQTPQSDKKDGYVCKLWDSDLTVRVNLWHRDNQVVH